MTFVMFTMGGAVLAYLGFMTTVLGAECDINVTPWQIFDYMRGVNGDSGRCGRSAGNSSANPPQG